MRSDAIRPGDVIAQKFRVRAIMSRSRGFLVEAFHTEFDQRVAIRVLSPALVDDKEVDRFRRESRVLAKLESEHVARIVDVGKTQDGAFYFARQYLEGQDLAAYIKQRGPLPLQEAVLYILQAAEAVAETHGHNIILRELQPAHLFLTQRLGAQQIKIIDFGTAKLLRENAAPGVGGELTATSMFGLSCYSSPELVRKAQFVDVRTDVWSLGAILYTLLTGRPPFEGEMAALMLAITRDEPVPVSRYRRDVPPEIDQIIGWSLAKDPEGRFANVHAFAHALGPYTTAEGQVLIKRIGDVTQAAKQRKKSGAAAQAAAVDRDHPVTMDGNDLLDDDDDDDGGQRTAYRPPDAPVMSPSFAAQQGGAVPPPAAEGQSLDRTMFMVPGAAAPSPTAQRPAAGLPAPPRPAAGAPVPTSAMPAFGGAAADMGARASAPNWQPIPMGPQAAPPAAGQSPSGPSQANTTPPPHEPRVPQAGLATIQASSIPGNPKAPPKGQKVALAVVAGAVVLLSVVALIVVFKGHSGDATAEATSASARASAAPATTASASAAPADTASAAPTGEPAAATNEPTAPAPVATPAPTPEKTAPTGKVAANNPPASTSKPGKKDPPPEKTSAPPPSTGGGGDNGTLVAVAVGGTCAFSVNGASKGTSSTIKISVKPGTYSVTCAPSSGSSKSKSVTVTSGGTAMAMFKL
jgi:serine/threonine-protein kinase